MSWELVCNPTNIPPAIEIDIAEMNIGDSLHIEAVKLPEGVTSAIKRNFTIATIAGRSAEEETPGRCRRNPCRRRGPAAGAKAEPAKAAAQTRLRKSKVSGVSCRVSVLRY